MQRGDVTIAAAAPVARGAVQRSRENAGGPSGTGSGASGSVQRATGLWWQQHSSEVGQLRARAVSHSGQPSVARCARAVDAPTSA